MLDFGTGDRHPANCIIYEKGRVRGRSDRRVD